MNHAFLAAGHLAGGEESAFLAIYFVFVAIVAIVVIGLSILLQWRIASKAGYKGAWSLLTLIPFVNFIVIIMFAFSEWPIQRALREATGGALPPGGYVPPGGGGYAPVPVEPPRYGGLAANPYEAPQAPNRPQTPYGVPPPEQQPNWPADPPETL